jgi:hypothetical protein
MSDFDPSHPQPGDSPGFYGEQYFDGQTFTGRRKRGAQPGEFQMTEWFVPSESESADADDDASRTVIGEPVGPPEPTAPAVPDDQPLLFDSDLSEPTTLQVSVVRASGETRGSSDSNPPLEESADLSQRDPLVANAQISAAEMCARHDAVITSLYGCPTDIAVYDEYDNTTIHALHRKNAEIARLAGIRMAITADQIAQRSAAELAGKGMARQSGDRTAVEMVKNLGGLTQQEGMAAIHAGRMMREEQANAPEIETSTDPVDPSVPTPPPVKRPAPPPGAGEPWLAVVSRALRANEISRAQSEAIRTGLGKPTEAITAAMLADAASELVTAGRTMTPERLGKLARQTRDRLDRDGVALREAERHAMRSAKIFQRADGMMQLTWVMPPELGMQVKSLCDRSTSPKLGGPRVGDSDADTVRRITDDPRSPDQILSDNLAHFIEVGATIDPSNILANPTASVTVLTTRRSRSATARTASSRRTREPKGSQSADGSQRPDQLPDPNDEDVEHFSTGQYDLGWINGHPDAVSSETVDRLACSGAANQVIYTDELVPIDVGSEQRLFSRKQRIALGAQFGGCGWVDDNGNPICERPPSWCEAHHVEHWYRDKGKTVVSNGILLCKSHHLQLHNDHWEIIRRGGTFWLIPPPEIDPTGTPRLMSVKSEAFRDLEIAQSA